MREDQYRIRLKARLHREFPGCMILKTDPTSIQGIPDIIVLYRDRWAALEIKRTSGAARQPNQEYWVDHMNGMSFASFIDPRNEEDVFTELQLAFRVGRTPRVPVP